jgi:CO/xanthine dehydrogenase FAD-binding subunit
MYFQPSTLDQAVRDAQVDGVRILAGGTDFYPSHGDVLPDFPILDLSRISEISGILRTETGWRIGAMTSWSDLIAKDLPRAFDGLKVAAREVGSVQIQNQATIAGNLCNASPAADGVPPLLALDAQVELIGPLGQRLLPLDAFLLGPRQTALGPNEILSAIHVPDPANAVSAFRKLGSRKYLVISIAMVAALMRVQDGKITHAHIAVGSCSPVALRLLELEAAVIGRSSIKGVVSPDHLMVLSPIDDVRGSAAYRRDVVAPLIERTMKAALETA